MRKHVKVNTTNGLILDSAQIMKSFRLPETMDLASFDAGIGIASDLISRSREDYNEGFKVGLAEGLKKNKNKKFWMSGFVIGAILAGGAVAYRYTKESDKQSGDHLDKVVKLKDEINWLRNKHNDYEEMPTDED